MPRRTLTSRSLLLAAAPVLACAALSGQTVLGQEPPEPPERRWSNDAEVGWVFTEGNSSTSSLSGRNVFAYRWDKSTLSWEASVLRVSSTDDRFAVGSPDDFVVVTPEPELDNDRLLSKIRFRRTISPRYFWYASWDSFRDPESSVNRRLVFSAGAGNTWVERERMDFRTTYGITYTNEDLELEGERNFSGYRLLYRLEAAVTGNTELESELTFDGSFQHGKDFLVDSLNGLSVSISRVFALKASLRLNYRNLPALEDIDLEDAGGMAIGKVVVPKKKLDTTFSTSLVISF